MPGCARGRGSSANCGPGVYQIHESLQTHTNNQLSALVLSVLENLCAHAQSSALVLTHLHQAKLPIMVSRQAA